MRALYDPFLHGSGRLFRNEVWFSFKLGQLDRYLYHHSYLIIDLLQFGILEMSGSSSSLIATLVSHLVSLLSSTSLFISSILIDRRLASWTTCLLVYITCYLALFTYVLGTSLCSHDSPTFGIVNTRVWHYLLGIWAFVSHNFIRLSPLAYVTV